MGIPKLSTDLEPYQRQASLGHPNPNGIQITQLVIDGPGLVYFIYHRLLAATDRRVNPFDAPPSYSEIGKATRAFLLALEGQGVQIEKIYFDGVLPETKRSTRLERMERTRARLEIFCKACPPSYKRPMNPIEAKDISLLLAQPPQSLGPLSTLPEPAFMVPAVLEELREGNDLSAVEVVPGEADAFCAAHAKRTGAAVLTNDSDLIVYDLGEKASVLLLSSLGIHQSEDNKGIEINGFCWQPLKIARQLGVLDLQRLAFERYQDAGASFNSIKNRARQTQMSSQRRSQLDAFREEYVVAENLPSLPTPILDPRVAELYYQWISEAIDGTPRIYLPVMIENHGRTSSWTYGAKYRTLAYSILNISCELATQQTQMEEYFRSGGRISPRTRQLYTNSELGEILSQFNEKMRTTREALSSIDATSWMKWRLLGLLDVCTELMTLGKQLPDKNWMEEHLVYGYVKHVITLDAVHIESNIQTVLYSIRILKQLVGMIPKTLKEPIATEVRILQDQLKDLPCLAEMMPSRLEMANERPSFRSMKQAVSIIYDLVEAEESL